jgi:hypothetical protein
VTTASATPAPPSAAQDAATVPTPSRAFAQADVATSVADAERALPWRTGRTFAAPSTVGASGEAAVVTFSATSAEAPGASSVAASVPAAGAQRQMFGSSVPGEHDRPGCEEAGVTPSGSVTSTAQPAAGTGRSPVLVTRTGSAATPGLESETSRVAADSSGPKGATVRPGRVRAWCAVPSAQTSVPTG